MLEGLHSHEVCRLALVIGAFIAIRYRNKFGVTPGGIIIPGLLVVLLIGSPLWGVTLVALSFPLYWIYKRWCDRTDYKRRTPMYILSVLSLIVSSLVAALYIHLGWLDVSIDKVFGVLVPAIIAFNFTKQKMGKVTRGTVLTTLGTAGSISLIYGVCSYGFGIEFNTLATYYAGKEHIEIKYQLLQLLVVLTVGYVVYRFTDVRSGGYMIAPVAAVLLVHPISAVAFLFGLFASYFLTKLVCEFTLTVGMNRYFLALFISTMIVWGTEIIFICLDSTILPFQDCDIFAIVAMMTYANDGILYSNKRIFRCMLVTVSIAIASLFVVNVLSVVLM